MFANQTLQHRKVNNKNENKTSLIFPFESNTNNKLSKSSFNFFIITIDYMKEENM